MENPGEDQKNLINELKQGRELAKQLQVHLNVPSSPHEIRELLVHKILSSYEKALSMLGKTSGINAGTAAGEGIGGGRSESPRSFSGSPRSEDSDREFKAEHASRKRKSGMHRWSQQVQVSPGGGLEGPLDDGYSWRKYGQKDILGAKFPRGYYRCTQRMAKGCLATKQVQRNDDNPTIFEVIYRGKHTCNQGPHQSPTPPPPPPPPEKQETIDQPPQNHPQTPDMLLNFQTGLKVITENLDTPELQSFPSFHFGSTSNHNVGINYSVPASLLIDNDFPANYSPSFISPATSESNYFSVSPTSNFQATDCELSEVVSGATSVTNSTTVGLGFPFGQMEFDHNFTFDNPRFFS